MERREPRGHYPPEVRARAVRTVLDCAGDHGSQWEAIVSIAGKIGCTSETLRRWVRQSERDEGMRPGQTSGEQARIRELEREVRELRQANGILRKASAYFAPLSANARIRLSGKEAEPDRRFKP